MISYELAKNLKEAGFKQGTFGYYLDFNGEPATGVMRPSWAYVPTLDELIEACEAITDSWGLGRLDGKYYVSSFMQKHRDIWIEGFSTPEEGMSRLWLKLNGHD